MGKVYFPNINSLRFFAAVCVIFYHVKLWPLLFRPERRSELDAWYNSSLSSLSHICVSTFFVLCSFLITSLLLQEKAKTGTINIKFFYIRRICRIWPLYYLIIAVSFFLLPSFDLISAPGYPASYYNDFYLSLFFCVFLLPNITFKVMGFGNILAGPTWTIGVEEPFYIVWPWLVKKSNNLLRMMMITAGICVIVKVALTVAATVHPEQKSLLAAHDIWNISTVTSFPIGGIAAWLFFNRQERILAVIYNIYFRVAVYIVSVAILIANIKFPFYFEYYSIVVAILVLNMATNNQTMLNLDNKILNYLGRITYGFYMYHVMVIAFVFKYFSSGNGIVIYTLVYLLTTVIAIGSYELIEKRFLHAKLKYAVIPSTDAKSEAIF